MGRNTQLSSAVGSAVAIVLFLMSALGTPPPQSKTTSDLLKDRVDRGDLSALKEIAALPPNDAIRILRPYAQRGIWSGPYPEPPGVHEEAIRFIVQIPGHAEYSAKVIEESRKLPAHEYDTRRVNEFHMLSTYESEEAIEVLGRYLDDPTPKIDPIPENDKDLRDWWPRSSNAALAAMTLRSINLPDPPLKQSGRVDGRREIEIFKKWWIERQSKESSAGLPTPAATIPSALPSKTPVRTRLKTEGAHYVASRPFEWIAWMVAGLAAIGILWLVLKKRT